MCCISQLYKYEYYSAIKKEGNPAICDYMDELWRHYTKWSKPDRKTSVAAAKLRQSCLTLCDPIDGSPPGSRPWDFPGKNTGVGCHFLLQCMKVKSESGVAQSCPSLRDPVDWSLPGSSVHRIFQARVLEWAAIAFSDAVGIKTYKSFLREERSSLLS